MTSNVIRNDMLLKAIRPAVQFRDEPNLAWGLAPSFLLSSQLRAFWPLSSVDENGDPYDVSGQARTLSNTNTVTYGLQTLIPYAAFVGASSQRLTRADEAGLSMTSSVFCGCWVRFTNAATVDEYIIAKWGAAGSRSYALLRRSTGVLRFQVSVDGTASATVDSTTTLSSATWYWVWGMHQPSTVWCGIDRAWWSTEGAANIHDNASSLNLGSDSQPANYMTGRIALPLLCAGVQTSVATAGISRGQIRNLFEQTRANYGKA